MWTKSKPRVMTPEEFRDRMTAVMATADVEVRHGDGDSLMCELLKQLGYGDGAAIFERAQKWYS